MPYNLNVSCHCISDKLDAFDTFLIIVRYFIHWPECGNAMFQLILKLLMWLGQTSKQYQMTQKAAS